MRSRTRARRRRRLERNLAVGRRLGNRLPRARRSSASTRAVELGLRPCVRAVVVRVVRIVGARLVVSCAAGRARGRRSRVPSRPPRGRAAARPVRRVKPSSLQLEAEIAGLQQTTEVAGGEVGFNPVAEPDQRAARTRLRRGDAGAERDRPVVPERFLPDQRHVRVGGAGDLHLVERRRRREDAAEDFLDLGFAAAGMKQLDGRPDARDAAPAQASSGTREDSSRVPVRRARCGDDAQPPRDAARRERERARTDALAGHRVDADALQRGPAGVRQLGPAVLRLDRAPVGCVSASSYTSRHVAAVLAFEETVRRPRAARAARRASPATRTRPPSGRPT